VSHSPSLDITAGPIGVDARHGAEFRIDRPHGVGDWLLLHFPLPMRVRDLHGDQSTRADACILFSPRQPQRFSALGERMVNHYVHLRGPGVGPLVERLALPVDEVVYPRPVAFIAEQLQEMQRERMRDDAPARLIFAALGVRLLATLARRLRGATEADSPRLRSAQERVGDVRARMRGEPWLVWSVSGMARLSGLSVSRFRALYRRFHGASPQEELIAARLERARALLTHSPALVSEVAASCGFVDPHYFSRLFSRRIGVAPSAYYRSLLRRK
jgi:AraC family transcriptional regulator of arabinose operon